MIKIKIKGELVVSYWPPYTSPDLCGFLSGDWGLGARASAQ